MPIGEADVILTFRVAVPVQRHQAFNLRDQIILALVPLGVRVATIDPLTVVRMTVDRSALDVLSAVPAEPSDDEDLTPRIRRG